MLVLCDFDGTITTEDVTNLILDKFTGTGWRKSHLPRYRAGEISHLDLMQTLYADLPTPQEALRDFYQGTPLRPNFDQLIGLCKERDWPLVVVSGGLDFYIREFLPADIPFHSYIGEFDEEAGAWRLRRPDWPSVNPAAGEDFKVRVFEELRQQNPQAGPSVFIGDGFNDYRVASHCDYVFAVRGTRLAQLCHERGKACTEFEDFAEVVQALQEQPR